MLTKKEAWLLIAETFVTEVDITPDLVMHPDYSTGICIRIHDLEELGKISSKTAEGMCVEVDRQLESSVRNYYLYPPLGEETEGRALGCILMAIAGL